MFHFWIEKYRHLFRYLWQCSNIWLTPPVLPVDFSWPILQISLPIGGPRGQKTLISSYFCMWTSLRVSLCQNFCSYIRMWSNHYGRWKMSFLDQKWHFSLNFKRLSEVIKITFFLKFQRPISFFGPQKSKVDRRSRIRGMIFLGLPNAH